MKVALTGFFISSIMQVLQTQKVFLIQNFPLSTHVGNHVIVKLLSIVCHLPKMMVNSIVMSHWTTFNLFTSVARSLWF